MSSRSIDRFVAIVESNSTVSRFRWLTENAAGGWGDDLLISLVTSLDGYSADGATRNGGGAALAHRARRRARGTGVGQEASLRPFVVQYVRDLRQAAPVLE